MKFSKFGEKFTTPSGFRDIMAEMGEVLEKGQEVLFLGGGNPAQIPEINAIWEKQIREIMAKGHELEEMLTRYDNPHGTAAFLEALADLLNREYGWGLTPENIAVTPGSQSAFFVLLNIFSGTNSKGAQQKILFPVSPEYFGYANQAVEEGSLLCRPGDIRELDSRTFKYHVDFSTLNIGEQTGALCVSRPTNPTGNVLTDNEVLELSSMAGKYGIPLFLDNAYGAPFPNIMFEEVSALWNKNIVLGLSLSKLGLPSARVGIIIADKPVIDALSACNTIISLSNGSVGQVLTRPLIESGEILRMSREIIKPFYQKRAERTIALVRQALDATSVDYRIHKCEGSFFLWIWFKNLRGSTRDLYNNLKKRGVFIVPGEYFFFGLEEDWSHSRQCIRLNFALDEEKLKKGVALLAEEAAQLCL